MAHPLPPGPHRALAGRSSNSPASTEAADPVAELLSAGITASAVDGGEAPPPTGFVAFTAVILAFVAILVIYTKSKLEISQVLQITAGATAISVAGYFGRNAIVIIGRRLITGRQ